jgi:hypothetical protein
MRYEGGLSKPGCQIRWFKSFQSSVSGKNKGPEKEAIAASTSRRKTKQVSMTTVFAPAEVQTQHLP